MMCNIEKRVCGKIGCSVAVLALLCLSGTAWANKKVRVPDDQKAMLTVQGQGVAPHAKISLSTGAKQTLFTEADGRGNFVFSNLMYASVTNLKFSIDIPPNTSSLAQNTPANHLEFLYDPRGGFTRVVGNIGKSGTLALNIAGVKKSFMQIAGDEGYIQLQGDVALNLAAGQSQLMASIVNVGEACCSSLKIPAPPVMLTISSLPVAPKPPPAIIPPAEKKYQPIIAPADAVQSNSPEVGRKNGVLPNTGTAPGVPSIPNIIVPTPQNGPVQEKAPKKNIPYIVQGKIQLETTISSEPDFAAASINFTQADFDRTYVGGLKKLADQIRNAVVFSTTSLGAMMDGRTFMDSMRALQVSATESMKNYAPSDTLCRFGTLTRSLAISEATAEKSRLAFSKAMFDRNNQRFNTIYYSPGTGINRMLEDFRKNYCEIVDNGGFLKGYCNAATATADLMYNRDVDFTRVFDVPLTLDADFTSTTNTNDQQALLALFHNLSLVQPYTSDDGSASFDPNKSRDTTQDVRAVNAARQVAENTFGALVAEKVKTTSASTTYMKAVLKQLGVTDADATKLIGDNPSYFAQMEVMTKKLFQEPTFYANLYESPANVDRQKVAMKAVELQQDRDFLESLRRREMLLSVLLNMKLRANVDAANTAGGVSAIVKK